MNWTPRFCCLLLAASVLGFGQSDRDAMEQRIMAKMQSFAIDPSSAQPDQLISLWVSGDKYPTTIMNFGNAFLAAVVSPSGLNPVGFGEASGGGWVGWWDLICRSCCPDVDWWDVAALSVSSDGTAALMNSNSKRMDPSSCQLTTVPDTVTISFQRVRALFFKPVMPGKLIGIVAAPAVGNQASQYRATVTASWNYPNLGVDHVVIATQGAKTQGGPTGDFPFKTSRPGIYTFILIAYNSASQPIDAESISIEIPNIPGIN